MKSIVNCLVILAILAIVVATEAWAKNGFPREETRRVTKISETHEEGLLIYRELRLSRSINPKQDIIVPFGPFDPEWSNVKKVEIGNWLRIVRWPGEEIEVFFDRNFAAQELDGILENMEE